MTTTQHRLAGRGTAGPAEIALVVAVTVIIWYVTMGWDWSVVPEANRPEVYHDPHTPLDWVLVYAAAMVGIGWLAVRGRAVLGWVSVVLVLAGLSGWRMSTAEVIGASMWPLGLAFVLVTLGAAGAVAALLGAWIRRRR